jgi:two-component system sporulation sensor kinase B
MIVFIFLWIIAIIVLISNPKSPVQRWFSATMFLAGLSPFVFFIKKLSPLLNHHSLLFSERFLVASSIYLFPYAFLMFTIYHFTEISAKWKKRRKPLAFILILPAVLMYGVFPFTFRFFYQPWQFLLINLWVVPYLIIGNFLLVKSYFKAQSARQRNNCFMTGIIIIPISLFDLFTGYILPGLGLYTIPLNAILIIILFIVFLSAITRYGALGVRMKIEKFQVDSMLKTMTSGAAILNHSIKNEIAKISLCATNLEDLTQKNENAQMILRSTDHILKMVERARHSTQDIILAKRKIDLKIFLEKVLEEFRYQLKEKNVTVTTNLRPGIRVNIDILHMQEVINNIIKNAIEAMESGGKINLKIVKSRGMVTIIVRDNGMGIPAGTLPHIFDPFFTTKNPKHNFGLGLLYCYKVMNKHGGKLEIESKFNKGTTVYLNLPAFTWNRFFWTKGDSDVEYKSIPG